MEPRLVPLVRMARVSILHRRDSLIDAVTMDDAKRVASRLLNGRMLVTIVGRPQGVTSRD